MFCLSMLSKLEVVLSNALDQSSFSRAGFSFYKFFFKGDKISPSTHLGKSVGGGEYTPIFGGGKAQFYEFNG